jgi:NADH-ubiquinone oxidoreductase chain 1
VSGFNIEYSAGPFAIVFIAEYTSIIAMRVFTVATFSSRLTHLTLVISLIYYCVILWV